MQNIKKFTNAFLLIGLIYPILCHSEIHIKHESPEVIGSNLLLKSKILDKEIPIKISLPTSFNLSSDKHTYPVIFIEGMHGFEFFHAVSGTIKHLADVERMPETIVIGIDGDSPSPDIYHHDMFGKQEQEKWPSWGNPDKYHAFFRQELLPFLKSRYRANDKRSVIGVSTSSFFPLYNLVGKDNLFDSYVFLASADIIGMGYSANSNFIDALVARMTDKSKIKPSVFFAVASNDVNKDNRYQANFDELTQRLKVVDGLSFSAKIYENEGHYDAIIKTILDFIESKYPKQSWSANYRDIVAKPGNALDNLDKYYRQLSELYGFVILPRATRWNNVNRLGYISQYLIKLNRVKEAIEISQRYTEYQPKSWRAFESLAIAYKAYDDVDNAIVNVEAALKLAKTESSINRLKKYLSKLRESEKTIY